MKPCYIIIHKDSDEKRRRNLIFTVGYVKALGFPVLIIEQDSVSKISNLCKLLNVQHAFIKNCGLFNRAWGFNCFKHFTESDKVILADNDIIINPVILDSLELLLDSYDVARPFNGCVNYYDEEATNNLVVRGIRSEQSNYPSINIFNLSGGICSFRTDSFYEKLGGFDERFEGWGGEDDEMHKHILSTPDIKIHSFNSPGIHLNHSRNNNEGNWQPNYKNNLNFITDNNRNFGVGIIGNLKKYE